MNFEALKVKYKTYVPEGLFEHNLRAAETGVELAARFGADTEKARIAGLLHDIAFPRGPELLSLAQGFDIGISEIEKGAPILLHGPVGAKILESEFGISDLELLAAVVKHTNGKVPMTIFEKIVFLADKMEPGQGDAGAEKARILSKESLDKAILAWIDWAIPDMISKNFRLHPDLVEFRNSLIS